MHPSGKFIAEPTIYKFHEPTWLFIECVSYHYRVSVSERNNDSTANLRGHEYTHIALFILLRSTLRVTGSTGIVCTLTFKYAPALLNAVCAETGITL